MKFRRSGNSEGDELDMTPMIDVIFQLLIFFMFGATFTMPEKKMISELPKQGVSVRPSKTAHKDLEMVKIFIKTANGGIEITCNERSLGDNFDELGAMLKKLASAVKDIPVVIDATPNTPFKFVIRAMDLSKQAKLTHIAFSAGKAP